MAGNPSNKYGRGAYGQLAFGGLPEYYDKSDYSATVSLCTQPLQVKSFYIDKPDGIIPKIGDPVQVYWKNKNYEYKNSSNIISEIEDDFVYDGELTSRLIVSIPNANYFKFEEKLNIKINKSSNIYNFEIIGFVTGKVYGKAMGLAGEKCHIQSSSNMTGFVMLKEDSDITTSTVIYNPFKYRITLFKGIKIDSLLDNRYKIILGWGSKSNSTQEIYLSQGIGYVKNVLDSVAEKNYLDLNISETGVIDLSRANYVSSENILEVTKDNDYVLSDSPTFERDAGKVANRIIYTGYKETSQDTFEQKISSVVAKDNLYFKLDETDVGNLTEDYNNGSIIVDYALLGNGEHYSLKQELFIEKGYHKKISLPISRFNSASSSYALYSKLIEGTERVFSQVDKELSDSLTLTPAFLYLNGSDKVTLNIDTIKKHSSNLDLRTLESATVNVDSLDNVLFDYCVMITQENSTIEELAITKDFVNNTVTIFRGGKTASLYIGDIYFVGSWETDSYCEFKVIESANNFWLSKLVEVNQEVSYTVTKQLAKVFSKLVDSTNSLEVFLNSGTGDTFTLTGNIALNLLRQHLDYDLTYIEVKNQTTGLWESMKLKSYTYNTLTFYKSYNLGSDYIIKGTKCEIRRVYITTDSTLSQKSLTDTIYEAYIIKDRYCFGFNATLDDAHIENILDGGTNPDGYIYSVGRIIGADYPLEKSVSKTISNASSIQRYGIINDIVTSTYDTDEDFELSVATESSYRSESVLKLNASFKYSELPSDLGDIKLIRYDNPRYGLRNYRVTNTTSNIRRRMNRDEESFTIDVVAEEVID